MMVRSNCPMSMYAIESYHLMVATTSHRKAAKNIGTLLPFFNRRGDWA